MYEPRRPTHKERVFYVGVCRIEVTALAEGVPELGGEENSGAQERKREEVIGDRRKLHNEALRDE